MGIANLSSHQRHCHIIHLLPRLPVVLIVITVDLILLLLHLPLSVLLIKDIGNQCRANQLMFVYYTSIYKKMI